MRPTVTMRDALADPALLGSVLVGPSWDPWRIMLIATMGEGLLRTERWLFEQFTGRKTEPGERIDEAAFIIGRRGGKDRAASVLATYIAGLCEHPSLVRGERGLVLLIAPDQKQASVTLGYIVAAFEVSDVLKSLVVNVTSDRLELRNGIDIEVRSASFRRLRGVTCVAVIATESAFWMDSETGSTNADTEILNAVRPTLATTGGPLILITSPYARRGEVYTTWRKHFGPDGDPRILVVQAASRDFNPTLPQRVVDRALERDPAAARAEYLGQFRSDIESYISEEAVLACVTPSAHERPPGDGVYAAFVDPAGGSGKDSFTLAIAHLADERAILDCLREVRPPFSPEAVVDEFATVLRSYGVSAVRGDHYAGEWPREQFEKRGVSYLPADRPKSDLYRDLLPHINSRRVELLDHEKLIAQLTSLERRTARSGKDSIDHPPGGHDDLANVVAGVVATALAEERFDQGIPVAPKIFSSHANQPLLLMYEDERP